MSSSPFISPAIGYESPPAAFASSAPPEAEHLRDLSSTQWRSGIAAWLGWLFDGLDMHLYTIVALPFVAELLGPDRKEFTGYYSSWIQASFLVGWALGGALFGRIGDRVGRSRALVLTILAYAIFTGLSFFAQTWWHLFIFRFLSALGIGGEWAIGASLLCETWPRKWRPWIAASLQSAVNFGVLLAMGAVFFLSAYPPRYVFLVGILPAFLVVWIRKAVPEPAEWHAAQKLQCNAHPPVLDLFRGAVRRTTLLSVTVCAFSLTAHWAFMFWSLQHLGTRPDVITWTPPEITRFKMLGMVVLMIASIIGNFVAAIIAKRVGYRLAIFLMCLAYFGSMVFTYRIERDHKTLLMLLALMGISQGVFGLFTMYLPPLFPTLLRTTGAGFCYNIGRVAAAAGTVYFGTLTKVNDYRYPLLCAAFLFLPAAAVVLLMKEPADELQLLSPARAPAAAAGRVGEITAETA